MNMNKSVCAISFAMVFSSFAMAESLDVRVVGTITPAACKPRLNGGGIIDYGTIRPDTLKKDAYTVLDEKQLDFSITCDAPAKVALRTINGRPNSVAGAGNDSVGGSSIAPVPIFGSAVISVAGLGIDGTKRIGGYGIRIPNGSVILDGKGANGIYKEGSANTWTVSDSTSSSGSLLSHVVRYQSWAERDSLEPVAFTNMSGKLAVQAYINKASELDLSKPVKLDGLTTLELIYL